VKTACSRRVNLKSAKALSLDVPAQLLAHADKVTE